jgi:phage terminase small subunit
MPLNKRKLQFVEECLKDLGAKQSDWARRAGYGRKNAKVTGCRLANDKEIISEIERRRLERAVSAKIEKIETSSEFSEAHILNGLIEVIDDCKAAGPGSWQMANRLKALELLGRHFKMFTDRVEVGADDALMAALMEGRKRARTPIVIEAVPIPALPELAEESECQPIKPN